MPCSTEDSSYIGGNATCKYDCSGFDTIACITELCGNETIEGSEICDTNVKPCYSIDAKFISGEASCNVNCTGFDIEFCCKRLL